MHMPRKAAPPKLDHPVRIGLDWILKNRRDENGDLFTHRSFSAKAGLKSPAHLSNILAGRQGADIEKPTAVALARAGDVRVDWLLTGQGPREPFDEREAERLLLTNVVSYPPATAPVLQMSEPQAAERYWTTDQVEDWLLQAADKTRHRGKHVNAVRRLLIELPTLMRRDPDMPGFTARALDAAAALDARDESLAPADLLYEMTMTSAPAPQPGPDGRSRWDEHGDRQLKQQGIDPPGWRGGEKQP